MIGRALLCLFLVFIGATLETSAFARPLSGTLRDQRYVSPTWGYSVRWYSTEWALAAESSVDGIDSLVLRDAVGSVAGFEGLRASGGDAVTCLDDLIANVESMPGATDVVVVHDEQNVAQAVREAAHSWIMLLVALSSDGGWADYVVYLDCRTLVFGEAVLARWGMGPASSFDASADRFDVLHAALPRSAGTPSEIFSQSSLIPLYLYSNYTPPFTRFSPHGYVVFGRDGIEQGMMTMVDGDERTSVVMIENSGTQPLTIDPQRFTLAPDPELGPAAGTEPARAVWEDTGDGGTRLLAPGDRATLVLTFADAFADLMPAYLGYWDDGVQEFAPNNRVGHLGLDCYGCAGGFGSRPKLRLSR